MDLKDKKMTKKIVFRQSGEGVRGVLRGDCLKTKEFTIRNRYSKIPIWDT